MKTEIRGFSRLLDEKRGEWSPTKFAAAERNLLSLKMMDQPGFALSAAMQREAAKDHQAFMEAE